MSLRLRPAACVLLSLSLLAFLSQRHLFRLTTVNFHTIASFLNLFCLPPPLADLFSHLPVTQALMYHSMEIDLIKKGSFVPRDGACSHYVMVSKFQWKPFWLAT